MHTHKIGFLYLSNELSEKEMKTIPFQQDKNNKMLRSKFILESEKYITEDYKILMKETKYTNKWNYI